FPPPPRTPLLPYTTLFRSNWDDPNDPIRKLIIPNEGELDEYGRWDASEEHLNYAAPGCQHKYTTTALLLVSEVCGAYCRFCFRKRLFRNDVHEASLNIDPGLEYRSEEHTSELQSRENLVCRLLLEKKKYN